MTKFSKQHLDLGDSNPNSWNSFSDDVPLIALVISRQALYWRHLSFS